MNVPLVKYDITQGPGRGVPHRRGQEHPRHAKLTLTAPVTGHSKKPECFLEVLEQYFPTLPKIELNRRGPVRPGWSAWGNEVERPADNDDDPNESGKKMKAKMAALAAGGDE